MRTTEAQRKLEESGFPASNPYDPESLLTGEEIRQGLGHMDQREWPDLATYRRAVEGDLTIVEIAELAPRMHRPREEKKEYAGSRPTLDEMSPEERRRIILGSLRESLKTDVAMGDKNKRIPWWIDALDEVLDRSKMPRAEGPWD